MISNNYFVASYTHSNNTTNLSNKIDILNGVSIILLHVEYDYHFLFSSSLHYVMLKEKLFW